MVRHPHAIPWQWDGLIAALKSDDGHAVSRNVQILKRAQQLLSKRPTPPSGFASPHLAFSNRWVLVIASSISGLRVPVSPNRTISTPCLIPLSVERDGPHSGVFAMLGAPLVSPDMTPLLGPPCHLMALRRRHLTFGATRLEQLAVA